MYITNSELNKYLLFLFFGPILGIYINIDDYYQIIDITENRICIYVNQHLYLNELT